MLVPASCLAAFNLQVRERDMPTVLTPFRALKFWEKAIVVSWQLMHAVVTQAGDTMSSEWEVALQ